MTKYIVQGGSPLFGEVHISGAKNAAVAILPAALLVDGVCRIENIPQISDVTVLLKILDEYRGVVIFTTNFIRNFDQAFLRRISSHICFEMPDRDMRERLWAHYIVPGFPLDGSRKEIIEKLVLGE